METTYATKECGCCYKILTWRAGFRHDDDLGQAWDTINPCGV